MRAVVLKKNGKPEVAFEIQEKEIPKAQPHEICIKVEAFGLNFSDVMAREGSYQDCPPLPTVLGYEVVGHIHEIGSAVEGFEIGQRVVSLTLFGAYAEYAVADARAAAIIPEKMDYATATALATQYGTAYYCTSYITQLHKGEHVLIQAAAGGVGTALVQLAKHRGCIVYGTAGSDEKLEYLRKLGVDHPINYNKVNFDDYIRKERGDKGLDVVFDSLGGKAAKKARKLLTEGTGRIICFGVASRSGSGKSILQDLKLVFGFGFLPLVELLMKSQGIIGVNMLKVAEARPDVLQYCIQEVVRMTEEGILKPTVGGRFPVEEIAKAHHLLQDRKSIGKIAVHW
ncbi:MAG: quinone oxidoreductase family protein [Aureispira sp.]